MKKQAILGLVLLFVICAVKGQDKIITVQGDTIEGRIISAPRKSTKSEKPWVIGIQAGGSYLTASTTDAENNLQNIGISKTESKKYYKNLRNGFHFSGDVHYLIWNFWGVGLKYSFFTSSAKMNFMVQENTYLPQFYTVGLNERLYVNYVGPSVIFQQWLGKAHKFRLTEEISVGYVHYRDEVRFDQNQLILSQNTLSTGSNYGENLELSIEYYPVPYLSIGANAGFFYSNITKMELSTKGHSQTVELDKDQPENISRLNYSLSISYHF
jgi:hypothetical protein